MLYQAITLPASYCLPARYLARETKHQILEWTTTDDEYRRP
ncbi:MAG: hypothetical protein OJF49_002274 [Ktedonobacterales bacterium]|nr:MAG: hypothetical protein OJF49_002274 [Ktedonobacterales bacterium]